MSAIKSRFSQRLIFTGTLRTLCPLHIGGLDWALHTDMVLTRDVLGRLFLPGSSLAGILRAQCDQNLARTLFGFLGKEDANDGHASRVYVDDAALVDGGNITLIEHVRIDRETGVAAKRARFDLEALDADSCFHFRAVLELELAHSAALAEFMRVLCLLSGGALALGRGTQRGYGELQLEGLTIERQDFSSVAGILAALSGNAAKKTPATEIVCAAARLQIKVPFTQSGPLMVKASYEGADINMLPRTATAHDGKHGLILPGSSIKGAFRSHAERLMRSLFGHDETTLIDVLFGLARAGTGKRNNATVSESSGQTNEMPANAARPDNAPATAGVLRFKTLYASNGDSSAWQALAEKNVDANDAPLQPRYTALEAGRLCGNAGQPQVDVAYHVAIDRFTGGAADNRLYTAVEPWHTQWPALEISLDCGALKQRLELRGYADPAAAQAAQVLLLHLLNDFCNGEIALGFASTRGYGAVSAKPELVTFTGPAEHPLVLDQTLGRALQTGSKTQTLAKAWTSFSPRITPAADAHNTTATLGAQV